MEEDDLDKSQIIHSNGQPYRIGWWNGWFVIQRVRPVTGDPDEYTVEGDRFEAFPPGAAQEIASMAKNPP